MVDFVFGENKIQMEIITAGSPTSSGISFLESLSCLPAKGQFRIRKWKAMPSWKHSSRGKLLLALQTSNSAASVMPASGSRKPVPLKRRGEKNSSGVSGQGANSSTSALEQLDFERGVCIPYRKYTPETVRRASSCDLWS